MAVINGCQKNPKRLIKLGGPGKEVGGGQKEGRNAPRLHLFVRSQVRGDEWMESVCDSLNFLLSLGDL